jgi:hypothetical protein
MCLFKKIILGDSENNFAKITVSNSNGEPIAIIDDTQTTLGNVVVPRQHNRRAIQREQYHWVVE